MEERCLGGGQRRGQGEIARHKERPNRTKIDRNRKTATRVGCKVSCYDIYVDTLQVGCKLEQCMYFVCMHLRNISKERTTIPSEKNKTNRGPDGFFLWPLRNNLFLPNATDSGSS